MPAADPFFRYHRLDYARDMKTYIQASVNQNDETGLRSVYNIQWKKLMKERYCTIAWNRYYQGHLVETIEKRKR